MRRPLVGLFVALALALLGLLLTAPPVAQGSHNPEAPTSLMTTSVTQNQIEIAWDAPSVLTNVNEYWVRHKPSTQSDWIAGIFVGVTETKAHEFTNLSPGTTYDIEVRSCQDLTFNHCSTSPATLQVTTSVPPVDYDVDNDGLIEVANLAQLNAIRWDLNGDGNPASNATDYAAAFPNAVARNTDSNEGALVGYLGCGLDHDNDATTVPVCIGYELKDNLDFDEDNDGTRDDTYTTGTGWSPIGPNRTNSFAATFDGNGFAIFNLFINRTGVGPTAFRAGLFGDSKGTLRNVGLLNASVNNDSTNLDAGTGALVGVSRGPVEGVYATGSVQGNFAVGGIVGQLHRRESTRGLRISHSWAAVDATGTGGRGIGGLVGIAVGISGTVASISNSYATGEVVVGGDANIRGGGVVGDTTGPVEVTNVLAAGRSDREGLSGHLHPTDGPTITASYFTAYVRGPTEPAEQRREEEQLRRGTGGTYTGWRANVWDFGNAHNYPVLRAPAGFDQDWDDTDGTGTGAHTLFGSQREPQPATNLRATGDTDSQIELTWTAPTVTGSAPLGDYSYVVFRLEAAALDEGTTAAPTYTITNPDVFNSFSVRATNDSAHGESAQAFIGPPGGPGSVTASADGDHIDITWTAGRFLPGTSRPTEFLIRHRVAGQTPEAPWQTPQVVNVQGRSLSAQIGDSQNPLIEGIEYDVEVAARNEMGRGPYTAANDGVPVQTNSTPRIALILNHEQVPVDPDDPEGPHQDVGVTTIEEGGDPGQLYAVMVHSEAQAARGHPPTTSDRATTIRVNIRTLDGQTGKFTTQGTTLTIPANAEVSSSSIAITATDDAPDFQLEVLAITGEVTSANANAVEGPEDIQITIVDDEEANYDLDGDGLIEIYNLEQLDAVRWDLDGSGTPREELADMLVPQELPNGDSVAAAYLSAFAGTDTTEGESLCGDNECAGYELARDLDFDTDGNGIINGVQDDANGNEAVDADEDPDGNGVHDAGDRFWNVGNGWIPIGTANAPYRGSFDGQGHTIANLFLSRSDSETPVGLFGVMDQGEGDFSVRNLRVTVSAVVGAGSVGAVAGSVIGSITGVGVDVGTAVVVTTDTVTDDKGTPDPSDDITTMTTVRTVGEVTGATNVGGIAGSVNAIADSWSSVSVAGETNVGGVAGAVADSVDRSFATGSVAGTEENAGGLVGHAVGSVSDSYSTATVGSGSAAVGGLVGLNEGGITHSYAAGLVDGAGGVADNGEITASYHASDITGLDGTHTSADLKTPTGATTGSIYEAWDADIWDFGTASQWPVLKVDLADSDETATWQEFGPQLRSEPVVTVTRNAQGQPVVSWTAAAGFRSAATVTYQVYRGERYVGEPLSATSYTDAGADVTRLQQEYRVVALLDGQAARGSAVELWSAHTITLSLAPTSVAEDGGQADVTLTARFEPGYNAPSDVTLTFTVPLMSGYTVISPFDGEDTLTISAGQNSGTAQIRITPIDNSSEDGNINIPVTGTADDYPAIEVRSTALNIEDDDIDPTNTAVTLNPASVVEGRTSTLRVTFSGRTTTGTTTVTVTPPSGVTVDSMEKDVAAGTTSVTFTLTATDNNIVDGDRSGLAIGVGVQSSETDNVVPPASIPMLTVTDDDTAPTQIIVEADRMRFDEDGGGQTVTVTARFPEGSSVLTTDTEVTVSVLPESTAPAADYGIDPATAVVTIRANAALSGVGLFTITPVDNDETDGARTIVLGAATPPAGFTVEGVTLNLSDDEGKILLSPSSLPVTEGGPAQTYTVQLAEAPMEDVVLSVEVLPAADQTAVTVSPTSNITFTSTSWNQPRTIRVTPRQDANSTSETVVIRYSVVDESSDDDFDGQSADVTVSVTDDDVARVIITPTDLTINEGATRTYSVRLNTDPAETVTVTVIPDTNSPDITVDTDPGMDGNQDSLVFTSSNWSRNQTVRVTAAEDDDAANDMATIMHGAFATVARENGGYAGLWDPVNVEVNDDETVGITIDTDPNRSGAQTTLTVDEGMSGTYTVVLDAQPTSTVTVTIAAAAPMGVTVDMATLTFTTTNWNMEQTVTVTAPEDNTNSVDERVEFEHTGSGAAEYTGLTETLTVTAVDNDVPGLTLTSLNPAEIAEGGAATYDVTLNVGPTADVVVQITSNNNDVTVADTDTGTEGDQNTLTFTGGTSGNWNTAQTVTLNAAEDDDAGDDTFIIRHRIVDGQSATEYRPVADKTFTASVADDETAGFTIDTDPATDDVQTGTVQVREGQTATYTVFLNVPPASGSVRMDLASNNAALTVSPSSITFSASNWSNERTVTVRGVNDANNISERATVTHTINAASTSANEFDAVTAQAVTVQVTDKDLADYDGDSDGLIEIRNLAQLNAIRWDPGGDGTADNSSDADDYAAAFPNPVTGDGIGTLGCDHDHDDNPTTAPVCIGYELMADLDFDENRDGEITSDDATYWNNGAGWEPLGFSAQYNFDGNGHTISNLFINRPTANDASLLGDLSDLGTPFVVRNVGLVNVNVTGQNQVGALAGRTSSGATVEGSYVTGSVTGTDNVGGLVGVASGSVTESYAIVSVTGNDRVGGLVGQVGGSGSPVISFSYTAGSVSGANRVGGLVGNVESGSARVEVTHSSAAVNGTGGDVGGLLGRLHNGAPLSASYAIGPVTGASNTGGLVGLNNGKIAASYSTGLVAGTSTTNHGGLVGHRFGGVIEHSHVDSQTSGRSNVTGDATGGTIANSHARTTAQLQEPTDYSGDYASWDDLDLDRDGTAETNDFWDFGTSSQYPALKADLNGDGDATWQEFGFQLRDAPTVTRATVPSNRASVSLGWSTITRGWTQRPQPSLSYAVYRDGMKVAPAEDATLSGTSHTDSPVTPQETYIYSVAVEMNGLEIRRGPDRLVAAVRASDITNYDRDGDGLLEIRTLEQLNAVRWDLNGDGRVDDAANTDAYSMAFRFPANVQARGQACPSTSRCAGYELMADLDFNDAASYATGDVNSDWVEDPDPAVTTDAGWNPIGRVDDTTRTTYMGAFEGNGNTISNLFIDRPTSNDVGLFADVGANGSIRNLGLVDVNVTGGTRTGAFVGHFVGDPELRDSYATGTITGASGKNEIGGLTGFSDGDITRSHFTGTVSGPSRVGGLVGFMGRNGRTSASYAEVTVTAENKGGGLVGELGGVSAGNAIITGSYAVGTVTGTTAGDSKVGGLVGEIHTDGRLNTSYFTGSVSGTGEVGGLAGKNNGHVNNSYAAGSAHGTNDDVGGLVGRMDGGRVRASYASVLVTHTNPGVTAGLIGWMGGGTVENSYFDTDATKQTNARRNNAGTFNNVSGKTALELTAPTGKSGIYSSWNADHWDFGTDEQYPALKFDMDNDSTASWQEFGFQLREPLALDAELHRDLEGVTLTWTPVLDTHWPARARPSVSYVVQRDGTQVAPAEDGGLTETTYEDTGLMSGTTYEYRVAVQLGDLEARWSNAISLNVSYDLDQDGLAEIRTLEQLDAIRHDLDGDGTPTTGGAAAYNAAFSAGAPECGLDHDGNPGTDPICIGYELANALDFNSADSYADGRVNTAWTTVAGWVPIGSDPVNIQPQAYQAIFDGNGHTIDNLYVKTSFGPNSNRRFEGGLFGVLGDSASIRRVGLTNADVTAFRYTGTLAGVNRGVIIGVYATGTVAADGGDGEGGGFDVGGLVGSNEATGSISASYSTVEVTETGLDRGGLTSVNDGWIAESWFDTQTSGQSGSRGRSTAQLQGPVGYTGIYSAWNLDVDGDGNSDSPWNFGSSSDYPTLQAVPGTAHRPTSPGLTPAPERASVDGDTLVIAFTRRLDGRVTPMTDRFTVLVDGTNRGVNSVAVSGNEVTLTLASTTASEAVTVAYTKPATNPLRSAGRMEADSFDASAVLVDSDTNDRDSDVDGLIEISTIAQLNAIRWDLNGDGDPDDSGNDDSYFTALGVTGNVTCDYDHDNDGNRGTAGQCIGYELTAHVQVDNDGVLFAGDPYYNSAEGWLPIGDTTNPYNAVFDGNNNTVSNLTLRRADATEPVGLFGVLGSATPEDNKGEIRRLDVTVAAVIGGNAVGALVGENHGKVLGSSARVAVFDAEFPLPDPGAVSGDDDVGGLVGANRGRIGASWSTVRVIGAALSTGSDFGGLAGYNAGTIIASYATGAVRMSANADPNPGTNKLGGIVGANSGNGARIIASYARGAVALDDDGTARTGSIGGISGSNPDGTTIDFSYFDRDTSGQSGGRSRTTAQLQEPTTYTGIYQNWNVDVDGNGSNDNPWNFGSSSDYPTLRNYTVPTGIDVTITAVAGAVTEGGDAEFTVTASPAPPANFEVSVQVAGDARFGVSSRTRTVTIGSGGEAVLVVTTTNDTAQEAHGSVTATVLSGTGYSVGTPGRATVSINDNDASTSPPPPPRPPSPPSPGGSGGPAVTPPADLTPSFSGQTVTEQILQVGTAVEVQLPAASGGDGTLRYTLTPALPAGLTFNPTRRTIRGTPEEASPATTYTYTARDADGDPVRLTFTLRVTDPPVPMGSATVTVDSTGVATVTVDAAGVTEVTAPVNGVERELRFTSDAAGVGVMLTLNTNPALANLVEVRIERVDDPAVTESQAPEGFRIAGTETIVSITLWDGNGNRIRNLETPLTVCLPVSESAAEEAGGQPLTLLHYVEGEGWQVLANSTVETRADGSQAVCAGATRFTPFAVGYEVPLSVIYDANSDGAIDLDEVLIAINHYFEDRISLDDVLGLIQIYFAS